MRLTDGYQHSQKQDLLYRRGASSNNGGELDQTISALKECISWKLDTGENDTSNLAAAYCTVEIYTYRSAG
jgi:hypothetical protein